MAGSDNWVMQIMFAKQYSVCRLRVPEGYYCIVLFGSEFRQSPLPPALQLDAGRIHAHAAVRCHRFCMYKNVERARIRSSPITTLPWPHSYGSNVQEFFMQRVALRPINLGTAVQRDFGWIQMMILSLTVQEVTTC